VRRGISVAWAELGPVQVVAIEPAIPSSRRARGVAGRMERRPVSFSEFIKATHEKIESVPCVGKVFRG